MVTFLSSQQHPPTVNKPGWANGSSLLIWGPAVLAFMALWLFGKPWFPAAFEVPSSLHFPAKDWIGAAMNWLVHDAHFGLFSFTDLTHVISAVIENFYRYVLAIISSGWLSGQGSNAVQLVPPLPWFAVVLIMAIIAHYAAGWKLARLVTGCLLAIAFFGQWDAAMVTLASIAIAVPLGAVGGLTLGLSSYRWRWFERVLQPILDLMQTVPVFAYLVPILFMFGFGPTSAVVATIVYALPPMTRLAVLALKAVPPEIVEAGQMAGCSRRQMTWKIIVHAAMPGLMVGLNQVIMLSLNMVIIASMIGAGGLGYEVLAALRRLDIGTGLEAGGAIVLLAVVLDRISQSLARNQARHPVRYGKWWQRNSHLALGMLVVVISMIAVILFPAVQDFRESWQLSSGDFWNHLVKWININFFDIIEGSKNLLLLNILIPFKRLLLSLPWAGVCAMLALVGWRLGGAKLAIMCAVMSFLIAVTGQWDKAMVTVYLCGISVVVACLIGMPVAIFTAGRPRLWKVVETVIDTLQTLPSFVYLMPAVMLFRVGDFTAMIAVVAYAIAPAIRYTAHGLMQVDQAIIEAGIAAGCTRRQLLTKIKLTLALPEVMLGINQTIMLALSMLVITALVGTRDLGQEVYIALTKADTGRGLVAGLAVAFIAIIADRLISAAAMRKKKQLGLV